MNIYSIVTIIALVGFVISTVIRHKKKVGQTLVCPLDFDCNSVIHSSYSKFFGIDVSTLGVIYYGGIASLYAFFTFFPNVLPDYVYVIGFLVSVLAVMFSFFLLLIQSLVIREWCFWCIISALISGVLLVTSAISLRDSLNFLLSKYQSVIAITHTLSTALGVGAVLVADIFLIKFLKDYRISYSESEVLNILSQIVWFALGVLIITGIALFLPMSLVYLVKTKFIAKIFVAGIIIVNSIVLNLLIAPKLVKASFNGKGDTPELQNLRRMAYAFGAVSIISWAVTFLLGLIRSVPFTSSQIIIGYVVLILIAVIVSQYMDYKTVRSTQG